MKLTLDNILKVLGVLWSLVIFVAGASFFFGGEWEAWKTIKERVYIAKWPPQQSPESGNSIRGRLDGTPDTNVEKISVPEGSVLILSSSAKARFYTEEAQKHDRNYLQVNIRNGDVIISSDRTWSAGKPYNPDLFVSASKILGPGEYKISATAYGAGIRGISTELTWAVVK